MTKPDCAICHTEITYPDGLNLRGGREVHTECARANMVEGRVRVPARVRRA